MRRWHGDCVTSDERLLEPLLNLLLQEPRHENRPEIPDASVVLLGAILLQAGCDRRDAGEDVSTTTDTIPAPGTNPTPAPAGTPDQAEISSDPYATTSTPSNAGTSASAGAMGNAPMAGDPDRAPMEESADTTPIDPGTLTPRGSGYGDDRSDDATQTP